MLLSSLHRASETSCWRSAWRCRPHGHLNTDPANCAGVSVFISSPSSCGWQCGGVRARRASQGAVAVGPSRCGCAHTTVSPAVSSSPLGTPFRSRGLTAYIRRSVDGQMKSNAASLAWSAVEDVAAP